MKLDVRIQIIFYFIITFLLGIPFWWYTTRVYRANLPHSQILELYQKNVFFYYY